MPTPTTTHSVETFFAFIEYTGAALHADPKTRDLETLVTTANDKLGKVVAVRTEAQRHVNRATAVRDFSFRACIEVLQLFERKASAELEGGEKAAGYKRLFPRTVAKFAKTNIEDRVRVFEELMRDVNDPETPRALAAPAKALARAWEAHKVAIERLVAAQAGLARAREKEAAVKVENITALRKLEGKLVDRFPQDLRRVRGYFPQPSASRAKKGEVVPMVQEGAA